MAIQIEKNFLPTLFFDKLTGVLDNKFNWFWNPSSAEKYNPSISSNRTPLDKHFMFTHILWDFEIGRSSPHYEIFEPILYFVDKHVKVERIIRMKLNLYTNQGKRIDHAPHYDIRDEKDKVMNNVDITILNFTTCNGGTTINKKDYKSVKNQALIFKNSLKHNGYVQTDTQRRVVLNIATS
jgi:hypothetical protein